MSTISALVLAFALAADPTTSPAPPVPAPATPAAPANPAPPPAAPAAKKGNYLKLAAPAFSGVNVDPKVAAFFSEHFAGALVRQGVVVLTASEISAMIGLERSKALAGCAEDATNCVAELSNALGVDGLVVGTVAKFGLTLQANIKVFSARDATAIRALTFKSLGEELFLDELAKQAKLVAPDLLSRMGREPSPTLEPEVKAPRMNIASAGVVGALVSVFLRRYGQWYSLEYERVLTDWVGVYIAPTLLTYDFAPETFLPREIPTQLVRVPYHASVLRLEFGGRFYWPGKGPVGWWAAPSVGVGAGDVATATKDVDGLINTEPVKSGLDFSAGLTLGYRWYPAEMIPVTVGLGAEWHNSDLFGLPSGRLHVGFAW